MSDTGLTREEALEALFEVSNEQQLHDTSWLEVLDEDDEPPLFTRFERVEFLRPLEPRVRGEVLVRWAVSILDLHAKALKRETAARFCVFLTFRAWEEWQGGEVSVPMPCLYVSPNADREVGSFFRIRRPAGGFGATLDEWLEPLNRPDLRVGVFVGEDEIGRVYLGYRSPQPFRSVGTYWDDQV